MGYAKGCHDIILGSNNHTPVSQGSERTHAVSCALDLCCTTAIWAGTLPPERKRSLHTAEKTTESSGRVEGLILSALALSARVGVSDMSDRVGVTCK